MEGFTRTDIRLIAFLLWVFFIYTKMKHTEGKWMLAITGKNVHGMDKYQIVSDFPYEGIMGSDTETPICDIAQFGSHNQAKANAERIVKCVNMHDDLVHHVRVLSNLLISLQLLGVDLGLSDEGKQSITDAREALEKATS